jgi:hypothetical protein
MNIQEHAFAILCNDIPMFLKDSASTSQTRKFKKEHWSALSTLLQPVCKFLVLFCHKNDTNLNNVTSSILPVLAKGLSLRFDGAFSIAEVLHISSLNVLIHSNSSTAADP